MPNHCRQIDGPKSGLRLSIVPHNSGIVRGIQIQVLQLPVKRLLEVQAQNLRVSRITKFKKKTSIINAKKIQ